MKSSTFLTRRRSVRASIGAARWDGRVKLRPARVSHDAQAAGAGAVGPCLERAGGGFFFVGLTRPPPVRSV
jgi:hypothetical protein